MTLLAAVSQPALRAANLIDSRNHVMIVIPQSDHRPGNIVFVAHRTQARRVQLKYLPLSAVSSPSQRAASIRMKCPLVKMRTSR